MGVWQSVNIMTNMLRRSEARHYQMMDCHVCMCAMCAKP